MKALRTKWKERLVFDPGHTLRKVLGTTTGNLGQDDFERYEVIDAHSQVAGAVEYTASTSLKPPFRTNHWLVQKDSVANVMLTRGGDGPGLETAV